MDISKFAEGEYARVGFSLHEGVIVKFTDEGQFEKGIKFSKDKPAKECFSIGIEINGERKRVNLNAKSTRNLGEVWGVDTKKWVGRQAKVHIEEKNVFGEVKKVVYYLPTDNPSQGGPTPQEPPKSEHTTEEQEAEAAEMADLIGRSQNMSDFNGNLIAIQQKKVKLTKDLREWLDKEIETTRERLK